MKFNKDSFKKMATYLGVAVAVALPNTSEAKTPDARPLKSVKTEEFADSKIIHFEGIENNTNDLFVKKLEDVSGPPEDEPEADPSSEGLVQTLTISASFITAKTEFLDANAREKAKNAVRGYLKNIIDLKNLRIIIKGTYSVKRPWEKNNEIAQERMYLGKTLVEEILVELGFTPGEIEIITEWGPMDVDMSDEEFNKLSEEKKKALIDGTQSIIIQAEMRLVPRREKINIRGYDVIVVDPSDSMKDDRIEAEEQVRIIEIESKNPIKLVTLEGGQGGPNEEAHLQTVINYINSMEKTGNPTKILILTDEPENSLGSVKSYQEKIKRFLSLAAKYKVIVKVQIFNPDKKKGGSEIFTLNTNTNILSPWSQDDGRLLQTQEWYDLLPKEKDDLVSK